MRAVFGGIKMGFSLSTIAIVIVVIYLLSSIKILAEYERGVIFRLGRLLGKEKGPGIIFVFAPVDRLVRISLRQEALEVPPQDIITRDNVTLKVNAVIFLRVIDPNKAVVEVSNYVYQTSQFAQTTLRSVLGEQELDELLAHREKINARLQSILDTHTAPWGVKVANVEVKQVDMPESMLRAMAKQAEAEREKRSKIIHAEGEFSAAQRLVDAAKLLATEPVSVQLRYLQTLTEIGVEKNTTVVFPVPVDFFSGMQKLLGGTSGSNAGRSKGLNLELRLGCNHGHFARHGNYSRHGQVARVLFCAGRRLRTLFRPRILAWPQCLKLSILKPGIDLRERGAAPGRLRDIAKTILRYEFLQIGRAKKPGCATGNARSGHAKLQPRNPPNRNRLLIP